MNKFSIQPEAQPYIDALKSLIPAGVHTSPSLEASCLVNLPVVTVSVGSDAPPGIRAEAFIKALEHIIDTKLQGKDRDNGQVLFGLGEWAGVPTRERHAKVAKSHDRHWTWENFRKEPLDKFLFAVYLKLYREGERANPHMSMTSNPGNESNTQMRSGLVGGSYVTNRYESIYNLPSEPGMPREFLQVREIMATRDGLEVWRQSTRWWNKNIEELPDLTLFGPGTLSIVLDARLKRTKKPGRVYVTEVKFPHALKAKDSTKFTILKRHQVSFDEVVCEGKRDWHGLLGLVTPTNQAVVSVRFPNDVVPQSIWYFEDLPEWLVPGIASDDNILTADSSGFATHTWNDLLLGHSYGLAWIW